MNDPSEDLRAAYALLSRHDWHAVDVSSLPGKDVRLLALTLGFVTEFCRNALTVDWETIIGSHGDRIRNVNLTAVATIPLPPPRG